MWALRRLDIADIDRTVAGLAQAMALDERTVNEAVLRLLELGFLAHGEANPSELFPTARGTEAGLWTEDYCISLLLNELHAEDDEVVAEIVTAMDRLDAILSRLRER